MGNILRLKVGFLVTIVAVGIFFRKTQFPPVGGRFIIVFLGKRKNFYYSMDERRLTKIRKIMDKTTSQLTTKSKNPSELGWDIYTKKPEMIRGQPKLGMVAPP